MNLYKIFKCPRGLLVRILSRIIWRHVFRKCGKGLYLGNGVNMANPENIEIGDNVYIFGHGTLMAIKNRYGTRYNGRIIIGNNVYIGRAFHITSAIHIEIGDGCCLANNIHITDCNHGYTSKSVPVVQQPLRDVKQTKIGANTFLGQNVNVLSGVTIGRNCVIGANAVVTKNIPDYSIAVGNPAKVVRTITLDEMSK